MPCAYVPSTRNLVVGLTTEHTAYQWSRARNPAVLRLTTPRTALRSLGRLNATNHVSGRVATVALDLPNIYGSTPPYDFDIAYVEVVVNYKVLA